MEIMKRKVFHGFMVFSFAQFWYGNYESKINKLNDLNESQWEKINNRIEVKGYKIQPKWETVPPQFI